MPGLSQLKQFNKDIISLGDEVNNRALRGEKVVRVPIPEGIADINDADDFIMGMPEIEAVNVESNVDDDLSEITQMMQGSSPAADSTTPAPDVTQAPDFTDLLNPGPIAMEDDGMPDLSMFDDQPEEIIEEVEEEPEEQSIADMDLSALLGDMGDEKSFEEIEELDDYDEMEDLSGGFGDENYKPVDPLKRQNNAEEAAFDDDSIDLENFDIDSLTNEITNSEANSAPAEDLGLDDILETPEPAETPSDNFGLDDILEAPEPLDSADSLDISEDIPEDIPAMEDFQEAEPLEDFGDLETASSLDGNLTFDAPGKSFEEPEEITENLDFSDSAPADDLDFSDAAPADDLDFNMDDLPEMDFSTGDMEAGTDDFTSMEEELAGGTSDFADNAEPLPSLDDMGDLGSLPSFDEPSHTTPDTDFDADLSDMPSMDDLTGDLDFDIEDNAGEAPLASDEISDISFDETSLDDYNIEETPSFDADGNDEFAIEDFDTSEMDSFIPETDARINDDGGFELGSGSDFLEEGADFEIPGFSDVETAKEEISGPLLPKIQTGKKSEAEELPPNSLTDAQYKRFLKNLSEYPLNVRLAFEELIVKDEYTDDAEFELIEKILNKAPARQVATALERMLDITLPVPRDFEHRSAEEYEAYKKSLSYQLKNKIIPAFFVCILCIVAGFGLFQFGKNCIYRPLKANSLYKQGYVLLEADEYPQSEIKFEEAVKYRLSKKWFFNYARGYRAHKQYIRAERMYQNILNHFNHDKAAGLEYASMELDDLANYENAENIVRRQVLDYHVNDQDGILLLGDIYLEWATEKDPEKYDLARQQYASLIQLYGSNYLFQSRMLRYFIRTDNLRQVLTLKEMFVPKEKSLSADDCTELSGYLLDKLYGNLNPSEEYLRGSISDVLKLLQRAIKLNPENPIAHYNMGRYFVETDENNNAKNSLTNAIKCFKASNIMKRRDIYKYIDSYRLLGEEHNKLFEYLHSQEYFTEGIDLYQTEHEASGLEGTVEIGNLYSDLGDINYFISGDYDQALANYTDAVNLGYDSSEIRYRIGYMQYKKANYAEALGSFMKSGDGVKKENNLLLAMANTLSLRGDDYAAMGYYDDLISRLDDIRDDKGILLPQANKGDHNTVETYLYASNNYGVTLYRLAKRTGNSDLNAKAIVQLSQSVRAWDALTRNQATMVRLEGSNLAEENIRYITRPISEFEPAIYTDIPKTLTESEGLKR